MATKYGFYIDLDERGSFIADVRDANDKVVFEVRAGNELGEDETSIFDDGFMRDKNDLQGLQAYLVDLKVIGTDDEILGMREFEAWQQDAAEEDCETAPRL